jgi:hypothetical protein
VKKFLEVLNTLIVKLPFNSLAGKHIPAAAREKVPMLDKFVIPFANQIVCGIAAVLLITAVAASGKKNSNGSGSAEMPDGKKQEQTAAAAREPAPASDLNMS